MSDNELERQLDDRLTLLEGDRTGALTVPDLPLADLVIAVTSLVLVIAVLLWWAY